jgi:SAM-dependent methyltransferase
MVEDAKTHWERIYREKTTTEVSWYQARPDISLALVAASGVALDAPIIDVGGGSSALARHLLDAGYKQLTVLDISATALEQAATQLGERADQVAWLEADITVGLGDRRYKVWHDRAVFHFLTEERARRQYISALKTALPPGGHLVMGIFALDGPKKCSGLDVVRYSPETLSQTLGKAFQLEETRSELHQTPAGKTQHFVYCRFSRS